jgi:hypothetical protein
LIDILNQRSAVIDLSASNTYSTEDIPFHFVYKKPATGILEINRHLVELKKGLNELAKIN